jgi:hypothetical protein
VVHGRLNTPRGASTVACALRCLVGPSPWRPTVPPRLIMPRPVAHGAALSCARLRLRVGPTEHAGPWARGSCSLTQSQHSFKGSEDTSLSPNGALSSINPLLGASLRSVALHYAGEREEEAEAKGERESVGV